MQRYVWFLVVGMAGVMACTRANPDVCCTSADDCASIGATGATERPCPSGLVCVDHGCAMPEVPQFTLTVVVEGSGGTVSSVPAGIACSASSCDASFPSGTRVVLTQSSSGAFLGWSNDGTGGGACTVTLDADRKVGASFGTAGEALWVAQIGGSQDDVARAVATDTSGNLIIVGSSHGAAGAIGLANAGGSDIFVAKLSAASGVVEWAKSFGGVGDDFGTAVAVDNSDDIYFAGTFQGVVDFGDGPVTSGGTNAVVVKLDGSGGHLWSRTIGSQYATATGIAVRDGAVVVVGSYATSITLNGATTTGAGADDAFMVDYTANGSVAWAKAFGGPGNDDPRGVAIDSGDNVVVVGTFSGTSKFGGSTGVASAGLDDGFLAKYGSANGAFLFAKPLGGAHSDFVTSVAVDASDDIFVVGSFSGTVDFGGPSQVSAVNDNMFVAKYSLAGAYQWVRAFGDPATVTGWACSVNRAGDIAVVGTFCGSVSFGGPPLSSVNTCAMSDTDIFAVRLANSDGSHVSSVRAGGTALDVAYGVAENVDGRCYLAGAFQGFAEFGGQGFTSAGGYDAIVLGLAPL